MKSFDELRESLKQESVEEGYKSPAESKGHNMARESTVDSAAKKPEKFTRPDGKVGVRMVSVKKDVINRDSEEHHESTKEYGKSLSRIQDKKKKDAISSADKDKLIRLKKMMSKEKYKSPTPAEIAADKKKDQRGKSRPSMSYKSAKKSVYKNMMGGLKEEVNESFIVHKNGKPLVVKGKPVTAKSKDHAQKAINTMSKHPFNKGAKFSVHPHKPSSSYVAPRGSKPSNAKDDPHNTAMIRTKGDNRPAWRYAERGESVEEAYQLVFKDKNGKVKSTLDFDSKEKAEKQKKVRSKRLKPQDGSYEIYQVKG